MLGAGRGQSPHQLSPELCPGLGSRSSRVRPKRRAAVATQKIDDGIAAQTAVVSKQPSEWVALEEFARAKRMMTPTDEGIFAMVTGRRAGFPSEAQSKRLACNCLTAPSMGFEED